MPTVEELQEMERENARNGNGFDPDAEGRSIEDMAEEGGFEPEEDPTVYIEGTTGQLSLSVGGRKPDSASFKMQGKEVPLADRTQFAKGSTVKLDVIARVDEIKFRDKHDDAGEVSHTTRVHTAIPISVVRLSPEARLEAAVMDFIESAEGDAEAIAVRVRQIVEQTLVAAQEEIN